MQETLVTPEWCRLMARYNRWQNRAAFAVAGALAPELREADSGAFWRSIRATLAHLLWADHVWMARLDGWERPKATLPGSGGFVTDWAELRSKRQITDARISRWAQALAADDLARVLTWTSASAGREMTLPAGLCAAHMFNHQTHHRGQVHAMLTAAGAAPETTDLFLMPEVLG